MCLKHLYSSSEVKNARPGFLFGFTHLQRLAALFPPKSTASSSVSPHPARFAYLVRRLQTRRHSLTFSFCADSQTESPRPSLTHPLSALSER